MLQTHVKRYHIVKRESYARRITYSRIIIYLLHEYCWSHRRKHRRRRRRRHGDNDADLLYKISSRSFLSSTSLSVITSPHIRKCRFLQFVVPPRLAVAPSPRDGSNISTVSELRIGPTDPLTRSSRRTPLNLVLDISAGKHGPMSTASYRQVKTAPARFVIFTVTNESRSPTTPYLVFIPFSLYLSAL